MTLRMVSGGSGAVEKSALIKASRRWSSLGSETTSILALGSVERRQFCRDRVVGCMGGVCRSVFSSASTDGVNSVTLIRQIGSSKEWV